MKRIVCLGGGTGLSFLLRGLKLVARDLTAVVTLTDDGGSSGRLRRELEMPPPGDIRACLVALAEDESFMGELFQYRFDRGDLAGVGCAGALACTWLFTDAAGNATRVGKHGFYLRPAFVAAILRAPD